MNTEISLKTRVRAGEDVLFQELQGEAVLLNLKTGVYFGLDKVGTRIWQLIEKHPSLQDVLGAMLQEYDVTEDRCRADLLELAGKMEEQGLIEAVAE